MMSSSSSSSSSMSTTTTSAFLIESSSLLSLPPSQPPSKRPKVEEEEEEEEEDVKEENEAQQQEEEEDKAEEAEQQDEEEELITFTACQLLCGNLDNSPLLSKEEEEESTAISTKSKHDNNSDECDDDDDDDITAVVLGQRRARTVLDLLLPFTRIKTTAAAAATRTSSSNDDEIHAKYKRSVWSLLDLVRIYVDAFDKIYNKDHDSKNNNVNNRLTVQLLQALLATGSSCYSQNNEDDDYSTFSSSSRPYKPSTIIISPPIWKLIQTAIVSNAHVQIANYCIDQALSSMKNKQPQPHNDNEQEQETCLLWQNANQHLLLALEAWPCNPSALLSMANLHRMGHGSSNNNIDDDNHVQGEGQQRQRLEYALNLYLAAAKCAYMTQITSIQLLEYDNNNDDDEGRISISDDDKFLVESILLQMSAQYNVDEDDDNDEMSDNDEQEENHEEASPLSTKNNNNSQQQQRQKEPQSKALVIASYMSAMLASCLGKHQLVAHVLRRFCGPNTPITRIHPNVWEAAAAGAGELEESNDSNAVMKKKITSPPITTTPKAAAFTPCIFPNAISQELLDTLRFAFRPNAPYWTQSQYERNVYYSFWTDWPLPQPIAKNGNSNQQKHQYLVSNAIEHYIVTCLLPRVQSVGVDVQTNLKGFEWWVHTRPQGANLGHQLHFDTDEALLDQDTILDVPLTASVTYLTVDDDDDDSNKNQFGATLLFDQTPQSTENAQVAWISKPKSKAFVAFPGDLLHGVLPCSCISSKNPSDNEKYGKNKNDTSGIHDDDAAPPSLPLHRLTFMVNFWACRIPDRLKERKLYGPSGPFPPRTAQHSWIEDIMGDAHGYPRTVELPTTAIAPLSLNENDDAGRSPSFMSVSPAWENIDIMTTDATATATSNGSSVQQPHVVDSPEWWDVPSTCHSLDLPPEGGGIHQRFFVKNAPDYFRGTLYEK